MKVDTNAAREFSNGGDRYTGAEVRLWVHNLADEVDRLRQALAYAKGGFALAYDAAEKRLNDEVLLHCGHHEARAANALDA
jgi:tRNA(Ile)-lysidine synthase TilS/MesJ